MSNVTFTAVSVVSKHKIDVDPFEDGCISELTLTFT